MFAPKEYLGDGLYVEQSFQTLKVTSENGVAVLEEVYMENSELKALIRYAIKCEIITKEELTSL